MVRDCCYSNRSSLFVWTLKHSFTGSVTHSLYVEHTQNAIGATQFLVTPAITFTVSFMLLFSIVIALFKVRGVWECISRRESYLSADKVKEG